MRIVIFFAIHKMPSVKYAGDEERICQLGARSEQLSQGCP